jgi:hypothetical protein
VLAALQRDGRIRSAQFNQRYSTGRGPDRGSHSQYGPRNVWLPDRTSWRSAAT